MGASSTIEGFVSTLKGSGLVEPEGLDAILNDLAGRSYRDPAPFAQTLVRRGVLTDWQAGKVLSGVQKGFFLGQHKVLRLVGEGAMSTVYEAEHVLMHRRVALKVLSKCLVGESSFLERFYREARALARLDHPNIVRGFDVGREGDHHYLVMELVDGPSLEELVLASGPLPPDRAAEMVRQAALGLEHAHRAGFVHRDIKPSNIKLEAGEVVKILDLGLVRSVVHDEREASLTRRHDEKMLGTVDYLSPEQAVDSHVVDIRSDVYSLGCTLYFLLTGSPPFPQGTLAERLLAHQMRTPTPIASLRSNAPESLCRIVSRMMEKRPEDRYATPKEVAAVLGDWLGRPPAPAIRVELPPPPMPTPTPTLSPPKAAGGSDAATASGARPGWTDVWIRVNGNSSPGPSYSPPPEEMPAPEYPASCEPDRVLIERWRQWFAVVAPITAKRRLRRPLDNRSYRQLYEGVLQACKVAKEAADAPTQAFLVRVEKLVSPWVTIHALKSFLSDNACGNFVQHLHEIDQELQPHRRRRVRLGGILRLAVASLTGLAVYTWRDHPALGPLSAMAQDLWSYSRKLIGL